MSHVTNLVTGAKERISRQLEVSIGWGGVEVVLAFCGFYRIKHKKLSESQAGISVDFSRGEAAFVIFKFLYS